MPQPLFTIETYKAGVVWFRILRDRLLDVGEIEEVGKGLLRLTELHPRISLVIEMDKVTHMSSSMLGKLVALHKAVKKGNGRMALCNLDKSLLPLFKVTKLDKILDLQPDANALIRKWQSKPL